MSEKISPVFNFSADDKLYLAVTKQVRDNFVFIIYMFLKKINGGWMVWERTDFDAFDDKAKAEMYYAGIKQVMDFQQQKSVNQKILAGYTDAIAEFYRQTPNNMER